MRSLTHSLSCDRAQDRNPRSHFPWGVHSIYSQIILVEFVEISSIGPKRQKESRSSATAQLGFEPAVQPDQDLDWTLRLIELRLLIEQPSYYTVGNCNSIIQWIEYCKFDLKWIWSLRFYHWVDLGFYHRGLSEGLYHKVNLILYTINMERALVY